MRAKLQRFEVMSEARLTRFVSENHFAHARGERAPETVDAISVT